VEITEMARYDKQLDKHFIPPQLMSYWHHLFDDDLSRPYVINAHDGDRAIEQINFVIMERPYGRFLFAMPFIGYGCYLNIEHKEEASAILSVLEEFAISNDCLTMSVSTHPLQALRIDDMLDFPFVHHNHCQMLPIAGKHPFQRLSTKHRKSFRNEISHFRRESDLVVDREPTRAHFDMWYDVYLKLCGTHGTVPQTKELFLRYWEQSKVGNIDFWVLRNDDEVAGGIFCAKGRRIIDYNTSAFDPDLGKLSCTTVVLNEYFNHLLEEDVTFFNMQSSKRLGDGTYNYKRRWQPFLAWHDIYSKNLVEIDHIREIPLEAIKRDLPGCYVLPYEIWEANQNG